MTALEPVDCLRVQRSAFQGLGCGVWELGLYPPRRHEVGNACWGQVLVLHLPGEDLVCWGVFLRLIDSCITQLKTQGPSRTCNESKEKEGGVGFMSGGCGFEFRVSGSGFRDQGSWFMVSRPGFMVQGFVCRVEGSGCGLQGTGCRADRAI